MREKIKLVSSATTGHFYTTIKNKRNTPDKIEMKKYDPVVRKHVTYKESKIKKSCFLKTNKKTRLRRVFLFVQPRDGRSGRRLDGVALHRAGKVLQPLDAGRLGLLAPLLLVMQLAVLRGGRAPVDRRR